MSLEHFSPIAYGVWRWREDEKEFTLHRAEEKIQACLESGITTIDLADVYGHYTVEGLFGRLLKAQPGLRKQIQIVTKCGVQTVCSQRPDNKIVHYDASYQYVKWSCERSLREMQTDHVDLLLIHRPDPLMQADETARALTELKQEGKILAAGVSNFTPAQFDLLQSRLDFPLATNQVEMSLWTTEVIENGTLDHHQRIRMRPMAWSPLGGGRWHKIQSEKALRIVEALAALCRQYDATPDQLAVAWLMRHPSNPLPVLGANNIARIRECAQATRTKLALQDWFLLYQAARGKDVP